LDLLHFLYRRMGATLTALSFNDKRFTVSGNVKCRSPAAIFAGGFANSILPHQFTAVLYHSGQWHRCFRCREFLGGPTPAGFGKVGSSQCHYIGGSGTVRFPSLFGDMTLKFFPGADNGQFAATVPTEYHQDLFGLAKVPLRRSVSIRNGGGGGHTGYFPADCHNFY